MLNWIFDKLGRKSFTQLVVIESFEHISKGMLKRYVSNSIPIYLIEPFVMYHHTSKRIYHGFPDAFPDYVEKYLQEGILKLLPEKMIDGKTIFREAADKAVEAIESVYPEYREEHKELIEYVANTLKSSIAENTFKKELCNRLAEFYSVNLLLMRIEKVLGSYPILFYPKINVHSYLYLKALISRANLELFEHPNIRFPIRTHVLAFFENLREYLFAIAKLFAQTAVSGFLGGFQSNRVKNKKGYSYGVTILSPARQLSDNQRGPDFIIDNKKIHDEEVVYFPLVDLTSEQGKRSEKIPGTVYYPPKTGRCFSHFSKWGKLLRFSFKKKFFLKSEVINTACNALFNYFRWLKVLENITIRHFITHCDFGVSHIGRNLALKQSGVQTWYFTDSMNHGCNYWKNEGKNNVRLPFWTYLYYDHFVTWDGLLAVYFNGHPGGIKNTHIVGCLWSGHIKDGRYAGKKGGRNTERKFILSVFDSTYSRNGITSYAEGIEFAEHILRLADDCPDTHIFLKEKKERDIHKTLDHVLGPRLLEIYRRMDSHPGITICSHKDDASEIISPSDMVISFPFTSTTFEALSAGRPAVWHDPLGYYKNTPYGAIEGVTTHSYEELKAMVLKFKEIKPNDYQNPIPENSILMDPYRDGKAVDRFRELLHSSDIRQHKQPAYTF